MNPPAPVTLDSLPPRGSASIAGVEGNDAVARRLREMGLLAGQSVRRGAAAPLGDPVIYFVRGFRLALRRSEARRIRLVPESVERDERPSG